MASFATLDDLQKMWRNLQPTERERAEALLDTVSDMLREEAYQYGRDLDNMILERESFRSVVKSVTVDVVSRALMTSTTQEPMTQFAQSAMGYSVSGSYLVPGGGIFIKESEKKRLKLTTQRFGVIEPYGN
ncbi:phage Gp19/Gp15/Gp42 family protein [Granulicatella adiacens]|uniref:phage Gp19/Gp15/Gp42 family protein n=1 Tax=Granulicatella adiacens TaxID=46124 RepID=UPI001C3E6F4D|nr:phage Gp19/Gp15/Gp42 family protein [Granulicatella adiacens]